jgi:predicted nuclease of restriction endonuclease-like (RecB) superfamily
MKNKIAKQQNDLMNAGLVEEIREMIIHARYQAASIVNSILTSLYWKIGKQITSEIIKGNRADYGKQIVATLSQQLVLEFGQGFSYSSLTRMMKFFEHFPDYEIVATLSQDLSWSHFRELLPIDDNLKREFYAEMCRMEHWSVRVLRERIDSMLYERTALSKKPDELISSEIRKIRDNEQISPEILLKDPYILDFLGLKDNYLEKDLEDAILRELENMLLELGVGFTFIERQRRISIDGDDFYIDLLFYNRKLRRLIAIDLKIGSFKAEYKGQMELYLRWLDKYERQENEESPIGIILCAGKKTEQIELLEMDKSGIHVAEYLTVLPPKDVLQKKLHAVIENSKRRLGSK